MLFGAVREAGDAASPAVGTIAASPAAQDEVNGNGAGEKTQAEVEGAVFVAPAAAVRGLIPAELGAPKNGGLKKRISKADFGGSATE